MFRAHQRLRSGFLTALAFGLMSGVFGVNLHAEMRGRDITRQVTVEVSDLEDAGKVGRYVAEVRLHNDTNGTFAGPILISVESSGIEGLVLERADGQFVDGTEYVRIVSDVSQLRAESKSASKRVYFVTEEKLTADSVKTFAPKIKVWQGEKVEVQAADTDPQPGRTIAGTGMRKPSGRRTSGTGETGLQPTPDPGFTPETETPSGETGEERTAEKENRERKERGLPSDEEVAKVIEAQNQFKQTARKIPGVIGTGTFLNSKGEVVIRVMVDDVAAADKLPPQFNGVTVEAKLVEGEILPYQLPNRPLPGSNRGQIGEFRPRNIGVNPRCPPQNPQEHFSRPVPIGTSISNVEYGCYSGTLGCRVKDRFGNVYILSNSHVLANNGFVFFGVGETIVQPSAGDNNCLTLPEDVVASLSDYSVTDFFENNQIDAAIALTSPFQVGVSTPCDGYGAPRESVVPPRLGMRILKYGRTTGLKGSMITGLNVEVFIGGAGNYVDIIAINPSIGAPGDSGSLVVNAVTRQPVALFFAGQSFGSFAVEGYAIPIQKVLNRFQVKIDGDPSKP